MCSSTTTPWKIEKHLCRCCHAEGTFTNMGIPCYDHLGKQEIYADILRECLNIYIAPVTGDLNQPTYTICADCIHELMNANKFKKQVLLCEQKFAEMYTKNVISVADSLSGETKVKIEFEGVKSEFKLDFSDEEDAEVLEMAPESDEDYFLDEQPASDSSDEESKSLSQLKENPQQRTSSRIKTAPKAKNASSLLEQSLSGQKRGRPKKKPAKSKPKAKAKADNGGGAAADAGPAPKRNIVNSQGMGSPEPQESMKIIQPILYVVNKGNKKEDVKFVKPRNFFKIRDDEYQLVGGDIYKCTQCEKEFKSYKRVLQHIKNVHYKYKYKHSHAICCTQCPERFRTSGLLQEHQIQAHGAIKMIKCTACSSEFISVNNLKKHMNNFHMLGTPKKCRQCDFVAFSTPRLKRHEEKHIVEKGHVCKFCGKAFVRRANWILHERIHTREKLKQCSYCDQGFVQRTSLKYHILKYHPGKPA